MRAGAFAALVPFAAHAAPEPVTLRWLGDTPPAAPNGITWGVPWPKGALQKDEPLALTAASGTSLPVQTWPLAFWPDGSVKWTGHAAQLGGTPDIPAQLTLGPGTPASPRAPITVSETDAALDIDTGAVRVRIAKGGENLIDSLTIGDRVVAERGRLIALRENREPRGNNGGTRDEKFVGGISKVTLEQGGPLRAVVKIEGSHFRADALLRTFLRYTVRLQFFAGSRVIKLTHSFVYDGDPEKDFVKGIGLEFAVPFREELHNRHVRLAGDADGGVWTQPIRMLPGFRAQAGPAIAEHYATHLAGQRVPHLADLDERARNALLSMPIWGDAKIAQLGPNNWSLHKRTSADASWLHVTDGRRARGLAAVGDVSGGLAVGVKDFWQKSAKSLEVLNGGAAAGMLRVWLWSPEAGAMDLRRYDEIPHGLPINYEDWKPGWGSAHGIANTHEVTLWAFDAMPSNEQLVAMARDAAEPPLLVCTPQYYHAQQAVGRWSLPDRTTPALRWLEDQIETLVNYYRDQVDERSWYGFWDYGDIMHNYDFARHEWRYDIGGWAWVNTELMPDLLLWYSFLRTGRADYFRFAEAMTRHTSEVDVHHIGPFAPLGSRHNVNHWGDGAKQPRISHAGLKRHYYFLTGGDGRIGDLLREQIDADLAYAYLVQFNPSHYVPNADGTPRLERPRSPAALRPENFGPRPTAQDRKPATQFGLDWMCYALNWTTEWERGGDPAWRAWVETDMRTMAKNVDANGRFPGNTFGMLFGGPENMWEMEPMYDVPEFWRAWVETCAETGRRAQGSQMTAPRLLAYAAHKKNDPALGRLAWEKLIGPSGTLPSLAVPKKVTAPGLMRPVTDPAFLGAPVGWQQHGVASIHWALNAIETLEFAKPWLPLWEQAAAPRSQ